MLKIILLPLLLVCVILPAQTQILEECVEGSYPPPPNDALPIAAVDLDLEPKERWKHVVAPRRQEIVNFINYLKNLLPFGIFDYITRILAIRINKIPEPYNKEIAGIAEALNVPIGEILACNIFYELEKLCTSIVFRDEKGYVFHGRNLDLGAWLGWDKRNHTWEITELLRPLSVRVTYKSKGKALFHSVQFAGTVGIFTGIKPGKFSFSLNSRGATSFISEPFDLLKWLLLPHTDARFASIWSREVMHKADSYEEARAMLSNKGLMAPVYYILAGVEPNEGTVISRSETENLKPMTLGSDAWFVVQTNYDNWKEPPFYDDRRKPAKKCLKKLHNRGNDKELGFPMMFDILSTIPVRNKATIYTALMCPRTGDFQAFRRQCAGKCYPW